MEILIYVFFLIVEGVIYLLINMINLYFLFHKVFISFESYDLAMLMNIFFHCSMLLLYVSCVKWNVYMLLIHVTPTTWLHFPFTMLIHQVMSERLFIFVYMIQHWRANITWVRVTTPFSSLILSSWLGLQVLYGLDEGFLHLNSFTLWNSTLLPFLLFNRHIVHLKQKSTHWLF